MDGVNCKHVNDEEILQLEITHDKGQTPTYTCRLCKDVFNADEAKVIIEAWA